MTTKKEFNNMIPLSYLRSKLDKEHSERIFNDFRKKRINSKCCKDCIIVVNCSDICFSLYKELKEREEAR